MGTWGWWPSIEKPTWFPQTNIMLVGSSTPASLKVPSKHIKTMAAYPSLSSLLCPDPLTSNSCGLGLSWWASQTFHVWAPLGLLHPTLSHCCLPSQPPPNGPLRQTSRNLPSWATPMSLKRGLLQPRDFYIYWTFVVVLLVLLAHHINSSMDRRETHTTDLFRRKWSLY